MYPGNNGLLTAAYCDATTARAHSYIVINFNWATPKKFHLCNTVPRQGLPEVIAYGPTSQPWTGRQTSLSGEGEHKDCLGTAGGVICRHTLAMAAGHCAGGVRNQPPVQRRQQQQQRRGCSEVIATAPLQQGSTIVAMPVRILHNLLRHSDAICILAKAQPKVVKHLIAGDCVASNDAMTGVRS